ncbi:MAG TPA: substrate-binding domain-containing protein, partial [Ignavibacteriaceae bacterium]
SGSLPEAILAVTYPVALGIYQAALAKGIKIPSDLKITCFGSNAYKRSVPSVFSFVDQPAQELGREAVKLLLKLVNDPKEYKSINVELKTKLVGTGNFKEFQLVI